MIPEKQRVLATAIAGTFAVIAPTIGPAVGGYLTTYSWHWIFLVNILPGLVVAATVCGFVRVGKADFSTLKEIDYSTIIFASIFLATLELFLNEAPGRHWSGALSCLWLGAVCLVSGAVGGLAGALPCHALHRSSALPQMVFFPGLRSQLCVRLRPLRFCLYPVAVPGAGAGPFTAGDRRDHDGFRRGPTGDGAVAAVLEKSQSASDCFRLRRVRRSGCLPMAFPPRPPISPACSGRR